MKDIIWAVENVVGIMGITFVLPAMIYLVWGRIRDYIWRDEEA